MGILDIFRKKSNKEPKSEVEPQEVTDSNDDSAPGWEAIDATFARLYPEQPNPKHYGTIVKYIFGGPDPLDGISIYDGGDFWHFVSYGLSDLYKKSNDETEYSGWGIEFTSKLKKSGGDDEEEIRGVCSNLQKMARYIFQSGRVILPEQYIYTEQETGIDVKQESLLTGFITAEDDLIGTIDTPHGKVQFVNLIGATDAELCMIYESGQGSAKVVELLQQLGHQITDYQRQSLV